MAGITAMLAIDALELSAGDPLLVVGAPGGVGSFAVQPGVRAGAPSSHAEFASPGNCCRRGQLSGVFADCAGGTAVIS